MNNSEIIKYLYGLLKDVQKNMFESYFSSQGRKYVIHCSRRLGKTFFLTVISCITAYSKSNAQIRYASVTQKAVRKMIHPIFKEVFSKIPLKYRPHWNQQEGAYRFPNGSEIHVAGVNNGHSDDLRGTAADLCVVDEAAFVDELRYLVDSVLIPQLLTTNGKLVMASSSPFSPAHEFTSYIQESRETGNYSSYDIYQGGYSKDTVEEFLKEAGGRHSTTARREYFNEIIVDSQYAIVPEWNKAFIKESEPTSFDSYFHRYVSMDIGTKDFTAILFGLYNFQKATLFITDEIILNGADVTTAKIADSIREREKLIGAIPYRRIADNNNLILLTDLGSEFDMHFVPTNKDRLEAMVNELRLWISNGRIIVSPSCTQTIGCLDFGVWNKDRKDWGRSKQYGHFDALASLMYMVRNIDQNTNPIPSNYGKNIYTHFTPPESNTVHENIKKILNLK